VFGEGNVRVRQNDSQQRSGRLVVISTLVGGAGSVVCIAKRCLDRSGSLQTPTGTQPCRRLCS
jgi:hypothetical protein